GSERSCNRFNFNGFPTQNRNLSFGILNSFGIWILAFGISLSACSVGPNYRPPKTTVSPSFANSSQPGLATNDTLTTWWRGFNDSVLNDLIARARAKNHDLRIA